MNKRLLISVVGPTASGKSELAVQIAKRFGGEIISADSRQIYKGMDIGSGKVEGKWKNKVFTYKGIPHYLIDEASPKVQYSVARFQKQAHKIIENIYKRGNLPIICGGTGLWADSIVYGTTLPEVKPNAQLRKQLSKLTTARMFSKLQKLDPVRAKTIDKHNPRRLIRALEIVMSTGKPVPQTQQTEIYQTIWAGLNPGKEALDKKIAKRLDARVKSGLAKEVANLKKSGVSWKRLESFGLEYKFMALELQKKLTKQAAKELLLTAIKQYAKRQMTWWKRNKNINWFPDSKSALTWTTQRLRKEVKS